MANAFVRKLSGFARLGQADVDTLVALTSAPRRFLRRQDVIREGDPPGPLLVVLSGWACRYKVLPSGGRQIMAFLLPGDACDLHVGLLAEMDHSIQTLTDADIAFIPRPEMDALMDAHPTITRAMYISQLADEGTLRSWIVSMGRRSSIQRVAHLMCELYLRLAGAQDVQDAELTLPLSQVALADALGMTAVHINRVLGDLRACGAMELRRGTLTIKDANQLVRVAGFDENYLHRRLRQGAKFK